MRSLEQIQQRFEGVGAAVRFDFETVTILPDGRVAMSFYDTTTELGGRVQPAMAVEAK